MDTSNYYIQHSIHVPLSLCSVAIAYANQRKIDSEAKQLQANAATFSKQTAQWLKLTEEFSSALKVSRYTPYLNLYNVKSIVVKLSLYAT